MCLEPAWELKRVMYNIDSWGDSDTGPVEADIGTHRKQACWPTCLPKDLCWRATGQVCHQSHCTMWAPVSEIPFSEEKTTLEGPISCSVIKCPEGEGSDLSTSKENTVSLQ